MDKLTHLIGKRLNQHKLGESAHASVVLGSVNTLLQSRFKVDGTQMQALTLKEGTLKIGTTSSVLNQELWAYQEELLVTIKSQYGQKTVVKIVITSLT